MNVCIDVFNMCVDFHLFLKVPVLSIVHFTYHYFSVLKSTHFRKHLGFFDLANLRKEESKHYLKTRVISENF